MKNNIKEKLKDKSIWQHVSFVMIACMMLSTIIIMVLMMVSSKLENGVDGMASDSFLYGVVYEICYAYRLCIADFAFLNLGNTAKVITTKYVAATIMILVSFVLMLLSTSIYRKSARTVIKIFLAIVLVDFIATIVFMAYMYSITLVLKALLIIVLLLALCSINKKEAQN